MTRKFDEPTIISAGYNERLELETEMGDDRRDAYVTALLRKFAGGIRQIWVIGSRANRTARETSGWDFIAFADRDVLEALIDDPSLDWLDVDLLVVCDGEGDEFCNPWKDPRGTKRGTLGSWDWRQTSESTATYSVASARGDVKAATGHAMLVYPAPQKYETDGFTCTVTEAIAWLAYGDERIAARYGAPLHTPNDEGRRRRDADIRTIAAIIASGLPGAGELQACDAAVRAAREVNDREALERANNELKRAMRDWIRHDDEAWADGHDKLWRALRESAVHCFDDDGEIPSGCWVKHPPSQYERSGYRIRRDDLRALVRGSDCPPPPEAPKLPYDYQLARGMLTGLKTTGDTRPTREDVVAILEGRFSDVSQDKAQKVLTAVWGPGKRGPRNRRNR